MTVRDVALRHPCHCGEEAGNVALVPHPLVGHRSPVRVLATGKICAPQMRPSAGISGTRPGQALVPQIAVLAAYAQKGSVCVLPTSAFGRAGCCAPATPARAMHCTSLENANSRPAAPFLARRDDGIFKTTLLTKQSPQEGLLSRSGRFLLTVRCTLQSLDALQKLIP